MSRICAFNYYGGKFKHLGWLLPLLPKCHHYCEPFGGAASVLLNREPSPLETLNDIDGDVINFFDVLRTRRDELVDSLCLTPYSREELHRATLLGTDAPAFDRARAFFIKATQTRSGLAQTTSRGRWAYEVKESCRAKAQNISRYHSKIDGLGRIASRLLNVQLESSDASEVIGRADSPETLFFCDPPYELATRRGQRAYRYEMDDPALSRLVTLLRFVKGRVAISGYQSGIVAAGLNSRRSWNRYDRSVVCHESRSQRVESLWTNFEAEGEQSCLMSN